MFLGKTLNLTVSLSTQEYKRVLVDYLGNNVNYQGVAYNGQESVLYFFPCSTVLYCGIFCVFQCPNMIKWHNCGIIITPHISRFHTALL